MGSNKQEGSVLQIDKLRSKELDQLFDAILSLESREECYQFFDDLATMNEISSLIQRFQVAKLLTEGHTYNHIKKEDRKSTRLNSSHVAISYAVFCLKKKTNVN